MKLSMLMLGVENLEKSVAFYRDVVGVAPKSQIETFAFLDAGDMTLVLSQSLGRAIQPRAGAMQAIFAAASLGGIDLCRPRFRRWPRYHLVGRRSHVSQRRRDMGHPIID